MRQQLQARNIKSHTLAPAKLKVFGEDGTSQRYGTPQAPAQALEERGLLDGVRAVQEDKTLSAMTRSSHKNLGLCE